MSGTLIDAHRSFADRSAATMAAAVRTDVALDAPMSAAAALTSSGATRLAALAAETEATSRVAATVSTPAGERAILAALRSKLAQASEVVSAAQQQATELAGQTRKLNYPSDLPRTPGTTEIPGPHTPSGPPHPNHLPESTLDGSHGTGSREMPIVLPPGALGPPNSGMVPGGTDWVEAIPGSGVWLPSDQVSGKLWMPSYPGELAPSGYEELAPGIFWPRPPSVDPAMDRPSYRGES